MKGVGGDGGKDGVPLGEGIQRAEAVVVGALGGMSQRRSAPAPSAQVGTLTKAVG
jgi:hypothetical protein